MMNAPRCSRLAAGLGAPARSSHPTPESPLDPAVVIGAAAIGIGIFVIRRR